MESDYEEYKNKQLENPDFRVKYLLAKEKLNLELMVDSINDAIIKRSSQLTLKRRINKLKNHISAMSL
jgi:hypothetical protein